MSESKTHEQKYYGNGFREAVGEAQIATPELTGTQVFFLDLASRAARAWDDLRVAGGEAGKEGSAFWMSLRESTWRALLAAGIDVATADLVMDLRGTWEEPAYVLGRVEGEVAMGAQDHAESEAREKERAEQLATCVTHNPEGELVDRAVEAWEAAKAEDAAREAPTA